MGSTCNVIKESEVAKLSLGCNHSQATLIHGYGGDVVPSKGTCNFNLTIDDINIPTSATIVSDNAQTTPLLIGHPVTESSDVIMYKDSENLKFLQKLPEIDRTHDKVRKITLWPTESMTVPSGFWGNVPVRDNFEGELFVEASLRTGEGYESCIPHTVLKINKETESCYR